MVIHDCLPEKMDGFPAVPNFQKFYREQFDMDLDGIGRFWSLMNETFNRKQDVQLQEESKLKKMKGLDMDQRHHYRGYIDKTSYAEFMRKAFEIRQRLWPFLGTADADRKAKSKR